MSVGGVSLVHNAVQYSGSVVVRSCTYALGRLFCDFGKVVTVIRIGVRINDWC